MAMSTKILVKAPNWVGDCILATPAIAFLRAQFPEAAIIVAAKPHLCSIFENNPSASGTIPVDDTPDKETIGGLIQSKFDAICLLPNSIRAAWFAKRLGIPIRVGYSRNWRGILLTHGLPYDPFEWRTPVLEKRSSRSIVRNKSTQWPAERPPHHMVRYYMNLAEATAKALGKEDARMPLCNSRGVPNLILPIAPEGRKQVEQLLIDHHLTERRLIGICPAAVGGTAKCWPNEQQAALVRQLAGEYPDAAFVSTAIKPEAAAAEQLERAMDFVPLYRLGESLDLPGIIALIDRLSLYVTNDSGSMHIAAARQVPIVGVFGPTDWNVTYPWTKLAEIVRVSTPCAPCLNRICPIDHRCMTKISVETVYDSARRMLNRESTGETGRFLFSLDSEAGAKTRIRPPRKG